MVFLLLLSLLVVGWNNNEEIKEEGEDIVKGSRLDWTSPVVFGRKVPADKVNYDYKEGQSGHEHLAKVELVLKNLPNEVEGKEFTLVGGGPDVGFHGPNATNFEGRGNNFAGGSDFHNGERDEGYKKDFTRYVVDNQLEFTLYYEPSDVTRHWNDPFFQRYVEGTEVTLSLFPKGSMEDRALAADINRFNWCIAGVGAGNRARIVIDLDLSDS